MDNPHDPEESASSNTMARRWARRIERCCCTCATYFPLFFVYTLTTWAIWVVVNLGSKPTRSSWLGATSSLVGVVLYLMLNWSYTTAVFTDPGSTTGVYELARRDGYSILPTQNSPQMTSLTVKSNGEMRYCKKCHSRKPDRAHHCSTCRRCVLKMDHHCPWLATCIGLRNHKAFILFLVYTTFFCLYSFATSGSWTWTEVFSAQTSYDTDTFMPVNYIMLCVVSGIIGIVVGAFTGWHLYLASCGQTTIECLEKTRYLSPLRKQLQANFTAARAQGAAPAGYGQQLLDIHSNALPGITRPEEGEDFRCEPLSKTTSLSGHSSANPAASVSSNETSHHSQSLNDGSNAPVMRNGTPGLQLSYAEMERYQAQKRHEAYMDETDSTKLPHAFDLGPKRNLLHLFGEKWYLWGLPICTTTGDGWSWEPSPKWVESRNHIARQRAEQRSREQAAGWGEPEGTEIARWTKERTDRAQGAGRFYEGSENLSPYPPIGKMSGRKAPSKADRILGRDPNLYADAIQSRTNRNKDVNLKRLSTAGLELLESDDDYLDREEVEHAKNRGPMKGLVLQPGGGVGASGLLRKNSPTAMTPPLASPSPRLQDDKRLTFSSRRESEDDGVD